MQIKEILLQGRWVLKEIEELAEARDRAYQSLTSVTQKLSQVKVSGGKRDKDEKLADYIDLSEKIDKKIAELLVVKQRIFDLINSLKNGMERTLLTAKYINLKTWEDISEDTGYSVMQLHRIHKAALEKLEKGDVKKVQTAKNKEI